MYTTIANQQIYFQKVGKGKDLILLHGWGLDISSFWPVVEFLKDDFTLWMIDLPGHGRSEPPKKTFGVSDYADTVEQFIKIQRIKRPVVLGHSYGGRVTIKLASKHPNILEKIILENSAGISKRGRIKNEIFKILAKLAKYGIPNIFNFKQNLRVKIYRSLDSDYKDTGLLKETFLKSIKEDLTDDLKKINLPSLIIWGEKDKTTPLESSKRMYRLLKNSKLLIIDEVGHAPHITVPERFAKYVADFV